MRVTNVKLKNLEGQGRLKAVGSVCLDEELVIHGIRVVEGQKGLFVSMPNRKGADGKYYSYVFLLDEGLREQITKDVLDVYWHGYEGVEQEVVLYE